jgi:hypothetical protein
MLRFSLRTLIGVVAAVAIACAALIQASSWVASAAWTVATLTLALATIAAILGTRRQFWTGFAIIGWLYIVLVVGPLADRLGSQLLTTRLLNHSARSLPAAKQTPATPVIPAMGMTGTAYVASAMPTFTPNFTNAPTTTTLVPLIGPMVTPLNQEFVLAFTNVGHALLTLLLAIMGGLFAARLRTQSG